MSNEMNITKKQVNELLDEVIDRYESAMNDYLYPDCDDEYINNMAEEERIKSVRKLWKRQSIIISLKTLLNHKIDALNGRWNEDDRDINEKWDIWSDDPYNPL